MRVLIEEGEQDPFVYYFMSDGRVPKLDDDFPILGMTLLELVPACKSDVENLLEEAESFGRETFVDVELRLHFDASPNQVEIEIGCRASR